MAQPCDTTAEAAAVQLSILRRKSGAERLEIAIEASETVRALALARLRVEHPEWSEADRVRELLRCAFGPMAVPAQPR